MPVTEAKCETNAVQIACRKYVEIYIFIVCMTYILDIYTLALCVKITFSQTLDFSRDKDTSVSCTCYFIIKLWPVDHVLETCLTSSVREKVWETWFQCKGFNRHISQSLDKYANAKGDLNIYNI